MMFPIVQLFGKHGKEEIMIILMMLLEIVPLGFKREGENDNSRCKSDKKRNNNSRSSIESTNIDLDADEDTPSNKGVEGTPCQLSIGSINNIVAVAMIVEDNIGCSNVKVLVDVVTGENLTIPNPEHSTRKDVVYSSNYTDVNGIIKLLNRHVVNNMNDVDMIRIPMNELIFGSDKFVYLAREDLLHYYGMVEIDYMCILAYITFHWMLHVIDLRENCVSVLDSLRSKVNEDIHEVINVVEDMASETQSTTLSINSKMETCSITSITSLFNTKNAYRKEEIDEIRTEWATFVSRFVSSVRSPQPHPFPISLSVSRNRTPPCVLRPTVSVDPQSPSAASFAKQPTTNLQRSWISYLASRSENPHPNRPESCKGHVTASCSFCAIGCKELFTDRHRCPDVLYIVVMLMGYVVDWNCMSMDFKVLRITRLIRASFGITRLICASFGITRLICSSFGITSLIGKGTARGRPTRGKKDAEMPPRRGARRGGRGRGVRRVQPEVQPVAQAIDPATPVVPDHLSTEAKHLRDFRKYNLTTFDGSLEDPTRAQLRLSSLETIFRYMKFPEDQKVQCAVFMLTDRGTTWWETTERMLGDDEFLNLEQDDMTVEQYNAEFDMLSRFAPEMIATEAARADKFVRGLRLDIQGLVRAFRPATHADALRLTVDLSLQERANSSKGAGGEFRRFQQKPFEAGEAARGKPLCTTCGKHHLGRCLFGTRTCFKCRQEGHTADRCLMRLTRNAQNQGAGAPHQGKVFATNKTEAERAGTVVTGTLPVLGHYALVLFDSGSSHSFICSPFVLHDRLEVKPLHHVLSVSTPSGECMLSKEKVKAYQIEIAGHVIEVTLLVLDMLDFDVILGMDWLAANHASIDCSRKEVISAMRASKLLNQGTWSILASVVNTREVDVSLSLEPVVRDYPDVFPKELPGLPSHREVEFAIELESGTVPISRAPYRMAPAELKELKVQLQKLLGKGFIRSSVSP
ncbi:gag protease polyprotein [Cucumis melo var. makuwa]|uniref:Gag protease polyprotein n=1 Tax=Cucumis melo var. makuwa TaxID=1194695 RepID=A0A5A7UDD3_CUCMM|nr:gag protease polyprotein [Cucumis melo var. makuwa]